MSEARFREILKRRAHRAFDHYIRRELAIPRLGSGANQQYLLVLGQLGHSFVATNPRLSRLRRDHGTEQGGNRKAERPHVGPADIKKSKIETLNELQSSK